MAVFSGARPSPSRPDAVFAAALPSPPKALSTFRVCFVDDESANCRLGLRMLARLGVPSQNIIVLADGNEAYDFMKRGVEVDVMLLDIRMPGVLLRPTRIVGNGRSPGAPLFSALCYAVVFGEYAHPLPRSHITTTPPPF